MVKVVSFGGALLRDLHTKGLETRVRDLVGSKAYDSGVFTLFNQIRIAHYMELYLFSDKIDCGYFLRISDSNLEDGQTV